MLNLRHGTTGHQRRTHRILQRLRRRMNRRSALGRRRISTVLGVRLMHHRLTRGMTHRARRLISGRLRTSRLGRNLGGCRPSRLNGISLSSISLRSTSRLGFSMRGFNLCHRSLHRLRLRRFSLHRLRFLSLNRCTLSYLLGTQTSTRTRSLRRARGGMPLRRETRTHRHSLSLRLLRLATVPDFQGL